MSALVPSSALSLAGTPGLYCKACKACLQPLQLPNAPNLSCSCLRDCRALVSHGFGNLHWAAAHVLSMAGAFCAGLAVYGFRAAREDVPGWQVCMIAFGDDWPYV